MAARTTRNPFLIVFATLLVAVTGFLMLRFGYQALMPAEDPATAPGVEVHHSVVALADGSTMVAERGSLGREMADWLNLRQPGDAKFLLAGDAFEPGSAEPTAASQRRIQRFVALMRGNRGITAQIVVFSDDAPGGRGLAERRAGRLRTDLLSRGLPERRVSAETQPAAAMAAPDGQGSTVHAGQMMIVLHRRS